MALHDDQPRRARHTAGEGSGISWRENLSVASVAEHYDAHLAPVYLWMAGGIDHAVVLGESDLADVTASGGTAVDLGAGFGMHAIPLARMGYHVVAIDTSAHLLEVLRRYGAGLNIDARQCDMLRFAEQLSGKVDLILCMGDTLTHLQAMDEVRLLLRHVAASLAPGGRFVATFRDYTRLPQGPSRFIPVRSDPDRIHTCFLEDDDTHVAVHDLIHERSGDAWRMKVGSYRKLRLSPPGVHEVLLELGLQASIDAGPRGMVKVLARMEAA